jgi:hypothetical protein
MKRIIVCLSAALAGFAPLSASRAQVPAMGVARRVAFPPGESPAATLHRVHMEALLGGKVGLAPGGRPTTADPTIISGKLLTTTLEATQAPATPQVSFKYSSPGLLYYVKFAFMSPNGQQVLDTIYTTSVPTSKAGKLVVENSYDVLQPQAEYYQYLGLYAQQGPWTLVDAFILDEAGNYTSYSASQIAALFPSVTLNVTNAGTPDSTPPTVSAGKLLTPTVKLGSPRPYFRVQLSAADDISGVAIVEILVTDPDNGRWISSGSPPSPFLSGNVIAGTNFAADGAVPTGSWTITGYEVCDVAGNCLADANESDVQALLGTTSFEVTN